jgi:hypothetical protein
MACGDGEKAQRRGPRLARTISAPRSSRAGCGAPAVSSESRACRESATGCARSATGAERGVRINPEPEAGGGGAVLGIGTSGNQGMRMNGGRINLLEEASIRRRLGVGMWNGRYTPVETGAKTRQAAHTSRCEQFSIKETGIFPFFLDLGRAARRCLSELLIATSIRSAQSRKRSTGRMLGGDFRRVASLGLDPGVGALRDGGRMKAERGSGGMARASGTCWADRR